MATTVAVNGGELICYFARPAASRSAYSSAGALSRAKTAAQLESAARDIGLDTLDACGTEKGQVSEVWKLERLAVVPTR